MSQLEHSGKDPFWALEPVIRVNERPIDAKGNRVRRWVESREPLDRQVGIMHTAVCRLLNTIAPDFYSEISHGKSGYLYLPFDSDRTKLPEPFESWSGFVDFLSSKLDEEYQEVGIGFVSINDTDPLKKPHISSLDCIWFGKRPDDTDPTFAIGINADTSFENVGMFVPGTRVKSKNKVVHSVRSNPAAFKSFCEGFAIYADLINKDITSIPAIYHALDIRTAVAEFEDAIPLVETVFHPDSII